MDQSLNIKKFGLILCGKIDLIAQLQEKDNDNDANEETTEMSETEMSE